MVAEFLIFFFAAIAAYYYIFRRKYGKLPKGPRGVPLFGNLIQLVKNPPLQLAEWADDYGPLMTIKLGTEHALVINDLHIMKEILGTHTASGRYHSEAMFLLSQGPYGVVNSDGAAWVEQRQFSLRTLVKFGLGSRSQLESMIVEEIQELIEYVKEENRNSGNAPMILSNVLRCSTTNTLWTILSGERINFSDKKVSSLVEAFTNTLQYAMRAGLGYFPWLKYLAPGLSGYNALGKATDDMLKFVNIYFGKHKETMVPGDQRDVIDAYLDKMDAAKDNPASSFHGNEGWKHSLAAITEMFEASSETTPGILIWLLFYLALDPAAQKKLQDEIDAVVGQCRDPSLQDKPKMPYLEAVILETFRLSSISFLGLFHRLTEDMTYKEYRLPKDLTIISNIYYVHHNKKVWKNPEQFRPERFLEENANSLKEHVIPFQVGRRSCPGEPLAKDMLFLYIAKLLQTFTVSPDPSISKEEYMKIDVGLLLQPLQHKICLTIR